MENSMNELLKQIKGIQDLEHNDYQVLDEDNSMACLSCIHLDREKAIPLSQLNLDEDDDLTRSIKSCLQYPIYQIFYKRLQFCGIDSKVSAAAFLASSIMMISTPAHSSLITFSLWKFLNNNPDTELLTSSELFGDIIPLGTPSEDAMIKLWDGQKTTRVAKQMGTSSLKDIDFNFPSDNILDVSALYHQTEEFNALFA